MSFWMHACGALHLRLLSANGHASGRRAIGSTSACNLLEPDEVDGSEPSRMNNPRPRHACRGPGPQPYIMRECAVTHEDGRFGATSERSQSSYIRHRSPASRLQGRDLRVCRCSVRSHPWTERDTLGGAELGLLTRRRQTPPGRCNLRSLPFPPYDSWPSLVQIFEDAVESNTGTKELGGFSGQKPTAESWEPCISRARPP